MSRNEPASDIFSIDLFGLLRRKFWFILFFIMVAVGLGVLYYFQAPKTFASEAKLAVDEQQPPNMNTGDSEYDSESPVEYYIEALKSTKVIKKAIDVAKLDALDTFADVDDPLAVIKENLTCKSADTKGQSGVMKIVYYGPYPDDCKKILEAITDEFENYIIESTKSSGGEMSELVRAATEQFEKRYRIVREEIVELSKQPHLMMKDGIVVNPHQLQQFKLQEDLDSVERERMKLAARVENLKTARDRGVNEELLMMEALQDINEGTLGAYVNTHTKYVQLKIEEMQLINEFGADHPKRVAIRDQIKMVNELRMEELAALRGGNAVDANGEPRDFVALFLDYLDNKKNVLDSEAKSLRQSVAAEQQKASKISHDVEMLKTLRREQERLEVGQFAMFDQLKKFDAMREFKWRNLQRMNPPSVAKQISPTLLLCIPGGLFLGAMFGLIFAGLKELAEKTFRSSDDVASELNSQILTHVHVFNRNARKNPDYPDAARELVTLHQPSTQAAESFRAIRTSLYFKKQNDESKVFQVTSPTPGDGKSTVTSNIGVSIAQSNRKVIILDADFRKPTQHKLFGIDNTNGLTSVLSGESTLDEVIHKIGDSGLDVIPCGRIPHNPAELLTEGNFKNLVSELRQKYDFVLIDSPPLMAVTDPSIIADHVDSVVLVLRIRNGVKLNAQRSKRVLDSVGANLAGVVINGLRRKDEGFYGDSYGYRNYGSSYGQANGNVPVSKKNGQVASIE